MWSGMTPGNPIRRFDLRHIKVTLLWVTATNTCDSQRKHAITKTRGGWAEVRRFGDAQCAVRMTNTSA
jgi:hypothetical protein